MLTAIKNKLTSLLQLIFVLIYIVFEELIWEGIAKPIYRFVHSFKILQKVEAKLHKMNAYVILVVFIVLLAIVQTLGLYAGILFMSGQMLFGFLFYLSKIPIAAFTFWIFRVTEDKLMQFVWFKWLYVKIMDAIEWLKRRDMYVQTMQKLKVLKEKLIASIRAMKRKYFAKKSPFVEKVKYLYKTIKTTLKK